MSIKHIDVMNSSFRDGFQSIFGARVFTKDFLPAIQACVAAGIKHFEAGGGARFQSLFFYCNENAFDMMDAFREAAGPDANLQTLARGINVVGLDSQSSDIIKLHAQMFKKHGMTTIRNFDALNDVNNLDFSGRCIVDAGLKHEIAVTMMELPPSCKSTDAHTPAFYIKTLKKILDAGIPFDTVCFKDASGTSMPSKVYETIKQARAMLPQGTQIRIHTHETAGISTLVYKAALEAGADAIDLAMAPVSGGTSQPDIVTMWHALRGTDFDLGIDIDKTLQAEAIFKECMKDYFIPPEALAVEPLIPWSPMPGGALTANTQMMRDNGILDKYPLVIKAMSETVIKGGFGTSVTPVSQFYFQQAFNNTMFKPWSKIAEGYGKMVLGYFGKTPAQPDPEIVKIASEQLKLEPTTRCPRLMNDSNPNKGIAAAKKKLTEAALPINDENIFIAATCLEKGIAFLKGQATTSVRKNEVKQTAKAHGYTVSVNDQNYTVKIDGTNAVVNGKNYKVDVKEAISEIAAEQTPKVVTAPSSQSQTIKSQMPGLIVKTLCNVGDMIKHGDIIVIIEAMKMENEIKSHCSGMVAEVCVKAGEQIKNGQILARIN